MESTLEQANPISIFRYPLHNSDNQLIPYTEFEEGMTPLEIILQSPSNYNISLHQCTLFDFPHTLVPLTSAQLHDPEQLLSLYQTVLKEITTKWQHTHTELDSYNLLLFKEWMLIVPRSKVILI